MTARQPFQILVPAKTTLEDASLQQASTQTDKLGEYRGIEGTTFVGRHEKNTWRRTYKESYPQKSGMKDGMLNQFDACQPATLRWSFFKWFAWESLVLSPLSWSDKSYALFAEVINHKHFYLEDLIIMHCPLEWNFLTFFTLSPKSTTSLLSKNTKFTRSLYNQAPYCLIKIFQNMTHAII